MLNENFVYLASLIIIVADLSYLFETIKGTVKPNRVTWFLWALAPSVAFFAELSEGVGLASIMTLAIGLVPVLVFIAALVKKSAFWKITKFDLLCGFISLMAIVLWYVTKSGNIAILFEVIADLFAGIPTIYKAYKDPDTESPWVYLGNGTGALITILTINIWNFANAAFPIYLLCMVSVIFWLTMRKRVSKSIKT